jgi:hypothetical protein
VAAGSEVTGIDIPLLTSPLIKVTGKVLDIPAGVKDVNVEMVFESSPDSWEGVPVSVRNGSFALWGPDPGKYTLRAQTGEGPDMLQSAPVDLDVGTTDIENVELRLSPPFDLSGHVEYEDDRAREAAKASMEGLGRLRNRTLQLSEDFNQGSQADIGDDDAFQLEKVRPGRYHVSVILGNTFVRTVRLGNVDSSDGMLDVRNGGSGAPLAIVMSAAFAEVAGTVTDSNGPVKGAEVMLMQERGSNNVVTDANGHYSFPRVRPGTYRLLAGDELNARWMDDDAMEDYEDSMTTLEVHVGDKLTQNLKLAPPPK